MHIEGGKGGGTGDMWGLVLLSTFPESGLECGVRSIGEMSEGKDSWTILLTNLTDWEQSRATRNGGQGQKD